MEITLFNQPSYISYFSLGIILTSFSIVWLSYARSTSIVGRAILVFPIIILIISSIFLLGHVLGIILTVSIGELIKEINRNTTA